MSLTKLKRRLIHERRSALVFVSCWFDRGRSVNCCGLTWIFILSLSRESESFEEFNLMLKCFFFKKQKWLHGTGPREQLLKLAAAFCCSFDVCFWPTGPVPSVRRRHLTRLLFIPHRADTFISIALPFVGGKFHEFQKKKTFLKNSISLNLIKSHRGDLLYIQWLIFIFFKIFYSIRIWSSLILNS